MVLGRKHVTRMTSIINTNTARSAKSRPKCPASVDSPRILVIAAPANTPQASVKIRSHNVN